MKTQGEFLFNSFQEALAFVQAPTNYEQDNGISIVGTRVYLDDSDFKIVLRDTNDNRTTMFLFFKNSTKYDIWKFWCPSEKQAILLGVAQNVYNRVDYSNKKNGGK